MEIKVEIIAKETIKPSSATPHHLKSVNLSIFDILMPPIYTGPVLFYNHLHVSAEEKSQKLKKSLSETLATFYPFAGKIMSKSIDCNDEGALFIEANIQVSLSSFLKHPDPELLKLLIPAEAESNRSATHPVLIVQANFFLCGGLAVSVSVSHKISDALSVSSFIQSWADVAKGSDVAVTPLFTVSSVFPPTPELSTTSPPDKKVVYRPPNCATRRFVFSASKIAELKSKSASVHVEDPTRVEAVSALLWKCATSASRLNRGDFRPTVLHQPVNLRRRISSLMSETIIGNPVSLILVKNAEKEMELQRVVNELRQKKQEFGEICKDKLEGANASLYILELAGEMGKLYSKVDELDIYIINSWCRQFFYEADFGWGKPVWVSGRGVSLLKNLILLMDAEDGVGIEAWVGLSEQDMSVFEQDQELLSYACLNPSIL